MYLFLSETFEIIKKTRRKRSKEKILKFRKKKKNEKKPTVR